MRRAAPPVKRGGSRRRHRSLRNPIVLSDFKKTHRDPTKKTQSVEDQTPARINQQFMLPQPAGPAQLHPIFIGRPIELQPQVHSPAPWVAECRHLVSCRRSMRCAVGRCWVLASVVRVVYCRLAALAPMAKCSPLRSAPFFASYGSAWRCVWRYTMQQQLLAQIQMQHHRRSILVHVLLDSKEG